MFGIIHGIAALATACIDGLKNANWDGIQQTETMKSYKEGRTIGIVMRYKDMD